MMRWRALDDFPVREAGIVRLATFVEHAAQGGRQFRLNPWDVAEDVLADAWKGLDRTQHPDDWGRYADIMGTLAGLWLDDDEREALYLDGREP